MKKAYEFILRNQYNHPLRAAAVRVERSGIDARVEELGAEMKQLTKQIGKLTEAMNKLQEELQQKTDAN